MKRILALILMLTMAVFCFASCASIEKYEDKLDDADYEVEEVKVKELKSALKDLKLDIDDYKVKEIIEAMGDEGEYVMVIKCGIFKSGKLVEDLQKAFKKNDIDRKVEKKGAYVFVGTKKGIKAATK